MPAENSEWEEQSSNRIADALGHRLRYTDEEGGTYDEIMQGYGLSLGGLDEEI